MASRVAGIYSPRLSAGGGAEATVLRAATALSAAGHEVSVFSPTDVDVRALENHFGMSLQGIRFVKLPGESPRWSRLPLAIRNVLLDRRQSRFLGAHRMGLFVNATFKSNIPGIGARNVYYTHFPHHLRVAPRRRAHGVYLELVELAQRILVHPTRARAIDTYETVLANSEFTRRNIAERWGRDATVVYPPCALAPGNAQEPRDKVIVTVGRFQPGSPDVPQKSQATMVRAFREMTDLHRRGWRFVLVGALGDDEKSRAFFRVLTDLADGHPIEFRTNVSREELESILDRARVYWHAQGVDGDPIRRPETQEHFGISVVEAMSHGVVPLVFGSAGPSEIVSRLDPGLTWQDTDGLRDATRELIDGELLADLSREAPRAAEYFSAERFDREFLTACGVDLAGRRPR